MNLKLADYIKKRNGVAMGSPKSLRNNLYRSLGSRNFASFWNYWNPIFGYYLGKYIYKPSRKFVPNAFALVITFLISGLIHDLVTSIVRGRITFFFSVWFLLMALAVIITKALKHDFNNQKWIIRVFINLGIIGSCLLITIILNKHFFAFK